MEQSQGDYNQRLVSMGDGGLTYQKMLQFKIHLQFRNNAFEMFEILEPITKNKMDRAQLRF
jgi:hypothetical protein